MESQQDRGNVPEKNGTPRLFCRIGIKLSASYSLIRLILHVIHAAILSFTRVSGTHHAHVVVPQLGARPIAAGQVSNF